MPVSGDTLLRLIRAAEVELPKPPRVIGIDDWAFRRGQGYGHGRSGGLNMPAITAVFTLAAVAETLGASEDLLHDLSTGMEPEDGCIAVYGTIAFSRSRSSPFAESSFRRSSTSKNPP